MSRIVWLFLCTIVFVFAAQAKPLSPEQVPEPLKPWIAWALQDAPEPLCPFIFDRYEQKRCSWPTQTHLNLTDDRGEFSLNWTVFQDSWISLPGDKSHWPLNVTVNDHPALVMDKSGIPSIKLKAGRQYHLKGEFLWPAIPDNLTIPGDVGLIDLRIHGRVIATPAIKNGQLWLKQSDIGQKQAENLQNNLDIQVFRKIVDDVPTRLFTHLSLEVSGEPREVKLPAPIPDGFIPLSLQSSLPAKLEADGRLLLQLRPGQWQIDIESRNTQALTELALKAGDEAEPGIHGPASEIWVFEAQPQLRVVEIEQLDSVDASLTNLPYDWNELPAYKITPGQSMVFKTISRGNAEPEPNQLNLHRKLWLDFDGAGYTVNDTITGKMTRDWRLNALPQTRLGKVSLGGANRLITQDRSGKQGVEVRNGELILNADSRVIGPVGSTSAVGWEQDFQSVSAELNLPPGWRLLAVGGVDNVPDSWISRWSLLDLFLVLIAALATERLWNPYWGALALLTLVLIWHEPDSPRWVWLNILAATALINRLPHGRFLNFVSGYRVVCWLALIMIGLPFMATQVRTALYPQLENPWQAVDVPSVQRADMAGQTAEEETEAETATEAAAKLEAPTSQPAAPAIHKPGRALRREKSSDDEATDFASIDPKAKVQTGPGLPQWQWSQVQLSWNGAVDSGQQLQLWYLTPTLTLLLNFARVFLVAALALLMFGMGEKLRFKNAPPQGVAAMPLWLWLLPLLFMPPQPAYADIPDPALLSELRNRLLEKPEPPDCLPSCAQIQRMKLSLTEQALAITLQIHAHQSVALPLPAQYEQWFPHQVLIDGKTAADLYRYNNDLWMHVDAGEHQVVMEGVTPIAGKFTLPLPLKPNRIDVESGGWQVIGLAENGPIDNQLQFIRPTPTDRQHSGATLEAGALPPFVQVTRTLHLNLDWRVDTVIERASPQGSAIVLAVPLLPGESVISPGIRVKQGKVEVNIPAQQTVMQWESVLEKSEKIEFTASQTDQWIEVLRADVSPVWHLETSGIAMMHGDDEGSWLPEWHPWPGEKIALQISRPAAVEGQTLTIDHSRLSVRPGQRSREAELTLALRSSQGSQHTLILPEAAVLQTVAIDGQLQPIRLEGGKLTLPVHPGKQEIAVSWREAGGITHMMKTPQLDLGAPSVNVNLNIGLGQDRWVLFAMGPKLGPAVLFWGTLIVVLLLALGLGKTRLTPLKTRQWGLLLIGLSQIPLVSAGIVIAWLMLLGWRKTQPLSGRAYFNALQIFIGLLTLVALGLLFYAVEQGLLGAPDMQIIGNQSSAFDLNWYQDRSAATLPMATLISVPLMVYRLLMLAWSLWLAVSLLNWLKWSWACFSSDGLWKKALPQKAAAEPVVP